METEKLIIHTTMNILEEMINASNSYLPGKKAQAFSFISGIVLTFNNPNSSIKHTEEEIIKYIRNNCYSLYKHKDQNEKV